MAPRENWATLQCRSLIAFRRARPDKLPQPASDEPRSDCRAGFFVYHVGVHENGLPSSLLEVNVFEERRDLTDPRLVESEERYRAVIENASDMIQSVRADGTFEFVNPAWLEKL